LFKNKKCSSLNANFELFYLSTDHRHKQTVIFNSVPTINVAALLLVCVKASIFACVLAIAFGFALVRTLSKTFARGCVSKSIKHFVRGMDFVP